MSWENITYWASKALAIAKKAATNPKCQVVIIFRNPETNDQLVAGDVPQPEMVKFLKDAAAREESPPDFEKSVIVDRKTGAIEREFKPQ